MNGTTLLQVAHAYHDSFLTKQAEIANGGLTKNSDAFDYDR